MVALFKSGCKVQVAQKLTQNLKDGLPISSWACMTSSALYHHGGTGALQDSEQSIDFERIVQYYSIIVGGIIVVHATVPLCHSATLLSIQNL